MSPREEWTHLAAQIRAAGNPMRSPHLPRFFALAEAEIPRILRKFGHQIDHDRVRDLCHDLLTTKLTAILAADNPRAFCIASLRNAATSWLRRGDADVAEDVPDYTPEGAPTADTEDDRRAFLLDARAALAQLSERDRFIVVAVAQGEDRDELAAHYGTSRANIDQILSRVRRRFREGAP